MLKLKSSYMLITTLACVLNVAVASYIHNLDSEEARTTLMTREIYADHQSNKCFEEFTLKTDAFLAEVKNKQRLCVEASKKDRSNFDLRNSDARKSFQSFVEDKMKHTQDALEECSKKTSATKYFQCVKNFEITNLDFLDEISVKSQDISAQLKRMENDEHNCLNKIIDTSKSNLAGLNLQRCLRESSAPISTPTPSSRLPIESDDEMNRNITKLQNVYIQLKDCTNMAEDNSLFDKCLEEALSNMELKNYLRKHRTEYFPKLNEIDKNEDTCLRYLAAKFISGTPYDGQLYNCLTIGREKASHSDEISDRFIHELKMFSKSLNDCKDGGRFETENCIEILFSEMDESINVHSYTILDENIDKIFAYSDLDDEGNCLTYALKKLQFRGVFMTESIKKAFENCFYN